MSGNAREAGPGSGSLGSSNLGDISMNSDIRDRHHVKHMRAPGGSDRTMGLWESPGPARRRLPALLLVAVSAACALSVTGCSATGSPAVSTAARTADASAGATALAGDDDGGGADASAGSSSAAPSAATTSLPPGSPAAIQACATGNLTVSPADRQEQEGVDITRFVVTNTGPGSCRLDGTGEITPQGPLGAQGTGLEANLAVSQLPFPDSIHLGSRTAAAFALPPGKTASFYIGWFPASPVVCEEGDSFGFNAPDDGNPTDVTPVSYAFGKVCNGLFYVSPMTAS